MDTSDGSLCHHHGIQRDHVHKDTCVNAVVDGTQQLIGWFDLIIFEHGKLPLGREHHRSIDHQRILNHHWMLPVLQNKGIDQEDWESVVRWLLYNHKGYNDEAQDEADQQLCPEGF